MMNLYRVHLSHHQEAYVEVVAESYEDSGDAAQPDGAFVRPPRIVFKRDSETAASYHDFVGVQNLGEVAKHSFATKRAHLQPLLPVPDEWYEAFIKAVRVLSIEELDRGIAFTVARWMSRSAKRRTLPVVGATDSVEPLVVVADETREEGEKRLLEMLHGVWDAPEGR